MVFIIVLFTLMFNNTYTSTNYKYVLNKQAFNKTPKSKFSNHTEIQTNDYGYPTKDCNTESPRKKNSKKTRLKATDKLTKILNLSTPATSRNDTSFDSQKNSQCSFEEDHWLIYNFYIRAKKALSDPQKSLTKVQIIQSEVPKTRFNKPSSREICKEFIKSMHDKHYWFIKSLINEQKRQSLYDELQLITSNSKNDKNHIMWLYGRLSKYEQEIAELKKKTKQKKKTRNSNEN